MGPSIFTLTVLASESDVYRRQILTSKVDPRAVRVTTVIHTNPRRYQDNHVTSATDVLSKCLEEFSLK